MQYNLGELFCGPGGLACGALCANIANPDFKITHKWATDYDADTCNLGLPANFLACWKSFFCAPNAKKSPTKGSDRIYFRK